jgi:hypothetical protein
MVVVIINNDESLQSNLAVGVLSCWLLRNKVQELGTVSGRVEQNGRGMQDENGFLPENLCCTDVITTADNFCA